MLLWIGFSVTPAARAIGERKWPAAIGPEGQFAEHPAERFKREMERAGARNQDAFRLLSARRTAFGSRLITSISVRAAPEGRRVPSSHLRTVPTPVPMTGGELAL